MNINSLNEVKNKIEDIFSFKIDNIKYIGSGVDSSVFLVNNSWVFKFGISSNSRDDYKVSKIVSDFFKLHLKSNIEIPYVDYYFCSDELQIIGYRFVDGIFATKEVYQSMSNEQKETFAYDVAMFLKRVHSLDCSNLGIGILDMKSKMLDEVKLIRNSLYDSLSDVEKRYIDRFEDFVISSDVFDGKRCLCHIDFNPDHILVDNNMNFKGVIDWGGAAVACIYAEFPYLLSDGADEIGRDFGLRVLDLYGSIDKAKALEYSRIHRMEYPITELVRGIYNNNDEFIFFGKSIIAKKCVDDEDVKKIML